MADSNSPSAPDRIDTALDRIEAALARRAHPDQTLARRHEVLRRRVTAALAALDAVIATDEAS